MERGRRLRKYRERKRNSDGENARKKIKKNKKGKEMITKKNEEQNAETVARRMGAT